MTMTVRYVMHQKGCTMIDYINVYVRHGVPSVTLMSFDVLLEHMTQLGPTVSDKN